MELYRNGYVVARLNFNGKAYDAWPLSDLSCDKIAESLNDKADDEWFCKYDMQHIAPDLNYTRSYLNYCKSINVPTKILLFESQSNAITVDDDIEITEVMGFDCIGTVYHSYLQTEFNDFKPELQERNITLNRYGLFDKLEDTLAFIELRKSAIASGMNLEDFWEETPIKISVVNIL